MVLLREVICTGSQLYLSSTTASLEAVKQLHMLMLGLTLGVLCLFVLCIFCPYYNQSMVEIRAVAAMLLLVTCQKMWMLKTKSITFQMHLQSNHTTGGPSTTILQLPGNVLSSILLLCNEQVTAAAVQSHFYPCAAWCSEK